MSREEKINPLVKLYEGFSDDCDGSRISDDCPASNGYAGWREQRKTSNRNDRGLKVTVCEEGAE